jgi:hypothetical protein
MPDCHKCPNDGKKSLQCIYCRGPSDEPHHDGQTFIALDQEEALNIRQAEIPDETQYALAVEFAKLLLVLETRDREIICRRLNGEKITDIARILSLVFHKHLTVQAVSSRIKLLARKYNVLEIMMVPK